MSSKDNVKDDDDVGAKKPFMLQLQSKKKRRREHVPTDEFGAADDETADQPPPVRTEPLVIPTQHDALKWKRTAAATTSQPQTKGTTIKMEDDTQLPDEETAAAVRALQEEAGKGNSGGENDVTNTRVIASNNSNMFVGAASEQQQYQQDLAALPPALDETAEAYQRVPIAEFGAALLRGMGWKEVDDDATTKKKDTDTMALPRPHRLGLGAIPATVADLSTTTTNRRGRRPDQFQRDQALQQQNEAYRIEREKQMASDRQRTLQNGSLVRLLAQDDNDGTITSRIRARIVKLVGVPGLNMVQLQREGDSSTTIIKRNEIDRLLTRQELDDEPFQEVEEPNAKRKTDKNSRTSYRPTDKKAETRIKTEDNSRSRDRDDRSSRDDRKKDDRKKRSRDDADNEPSKTKSRKDDKTEKRPRVVTTWVIPNIRVRVVTEKLGRGYYKEKGVVVDVTAAGEATLQMERGKRATVLDRVPERYLETALPKVGGNVIVLTTAGPHKFARGRLLERDSRQGVVQVFDDMSCVTLPLDDLAEWCGPLDDDIADLG